jgi:hypothetical protein
MRLAFIVAFKFMVFAEYMRVLRLPGGAALQSFMAQYIGGCSSYCAVFLTEPRVCRSLSHGHPRAPFLPDERDGGYAILTHIYLAVGCAVTVWLPSPVSHIAHLLPLCGVVVLGIGDAMVGARACVLVACSPLLLPHHRAHGLARLC